MSSPGAQSDAEVDAVARDARAQRRTWVIGGALLVLSALVVLVLLLAFRLGVVAAGGWPVWVYDVKDWLWAIGALVLIIGLGRAGSITGRRPFTTIVVILQVVVASPMTSRWLSTLILDDPQNPHAEEDSWGAVFMPYYLVVFALTLAAVILIARARAVPTPWNWAPMWAFGAAGAFGIAT